MAGLLSLDWPWQAMLPAALYLLIHLAEGETITPMLLANRFTLNPVLVIVSLFFWHAIWGVPGAFLPCRCWPRPRSSATASSRCSRWATSSAHERVGIGRRRPHGYARNGWATAVANGFCCGRLSDRTSREASEAERAGDIERRQIAGETVAGGPGAVGGGGGTQLVAGEDPAEHEVGPLARRSGPPPSRTVGGTVATQSRP